MNRGNVLVIGNSGVGKSTLINAVLGMESARTGWGTEGTTKELTIYESDRIPFRIIDTVGFEPSFLKEHRAINQVRKWSKASAKEGHEDTQINVIWFCVEGTTSKLFAKTIRDLSKATSMWENVPVIVVITKSYSVPERQRNVDMVNNAFASQKRYSKNLKRVLPVVAAPFVLNDTAYAPPEGITELIDATNECMPEGVKASAIDIAQFKLKRKRALSQGVIGIATTAAVVVGAVPIPFPDGMILGPTELAEINAIAQIYGVNKNEESKRFLNSIVEVGTVGVVAKTALNALKAIPGINLGAAVMNSIIAGSFVAALGEGARYAFEQVYLGEKTLSDIDWVQKVIESKLSTAFIGKTKQALERATDGMDKKEIAKLVFGLFKDSSKGDKE